MSDVMGVNGNVLESDFLNVLLEISLKFEQSHITLSEEDINLINRIFRKPEASDQKPEASTQQPETRSQWLDPNVVQDEQSVDGR